MEKLVLTLPPSVNHMYINGRIGHRLSRILSDSSKMWMQENALKTNLWRNKNGWQTSQYKTVVKLWFYFPDHRRRDTHNSLKILMDTLEKAQIFVDDKYALPQIIDYSIDKKNPRVEMEFQKVE